MKRICNLKVTPDSKTRQFHLINQESCIEEHTIRFKTNSTTNLNLQPIFLSRPFKLNTHLSEFKSHQIRSKCPQTYLSIDLGLLWGVESWASIH